MDDYLTSRRMARRQEPPSRGSTWDVLQYQKDVEPFVPRQGFSETKFHSGFMRRQGSQMPYLVHREEQRMREPPQRVPPPRQSYDILSSAGMDPSMDRAHGERREYTLGEDDVEGARRVARGGEHRAADGRRDEQGAARRAALERAADRERADEAAEQEEEAGLPLDRRDRRRPVAVGVAARARGVQRVHRQHEEDARGLADVERGER